MKKSRLPLYTFLAVFLSIALVSAGAIPFLLKLVQDRYLEILREANRRQSTAMAQLLENQLARGISEEEVLADFQASIAGSETDRGYVCVVDQNSTELLCHPDKNMIGMDIKGLSALFDEDFKGKVLVPWEQKITGGESGGGLLKPAGEMPDEVVYFHAIGDTGWTVSSHENATRIAAEIATIRLWFIVGGLLFSLLLAFPVSIAVRQVNRRYENRILREMRKSDRLLLNVLPAPIAARMKERERNIVDYYPEVTVLFCDIVNFTPLSAKFQPRRLVGLLGRIFSEFDALCEKFGVEKIKTIGDAYMAVCGLPEQTPDHTKPVALLAMEMLETVRRIHPSLQVRIGIHTGEVVAGVIGTKKFSYDLWGDTVNTASRLESQGQRGQIHCSQTVFEKLSGEFRFIDNGTIRLKGRGEMRSWFLAGR
jgi:class 3 adenylate cyclase